MEAGLDWNEDYNNPFLPNAKAYYGKSLVKAVFTRKFKEEPESDLNIKAVLHNFLVLLFEKHWINHWQIIYQKSSGLLWEWSKMLNGLQIIMVWKKAYCCIHSNARDFAKLGQLFLDDGKAGDLQILNQDFIEQMRTPTEKSENIYGMGLWINHDNPIKHYYFPGITGSIYHYGSGAQYGYCKTGSYSNNPKMTEEDLIR